MITNSMPSPLTQWAGPSSHQAPVWVSAALPIPKAETCGDWRRVGREGSTSISSPCAGTHMSSFLLRLQRSPASLYLSRIIICTERHSSDGKGHLGHCRGTQPNVLTQATAERWPYFSANSWPFLRNTKQTCALCILSPGRPNLRQFSQGCEHQEFNRHSSYSTNPGICLDAPSVLVGCRWAPNAPGKSSTPNLPV